MTLSLLALVTLVGRLDVSTGTPDALCPTLPDAEAAIVARVGEVSSGDYKIRYDLARSNVTSGKTLHVVLTGAEGEVLLKREIELEEDGCESAAVALALVVERFFERIANPDASPKEGASSDQKVGNAEEPPASSTAPTAARTDRETPARAKKSRKRGASSGVETKEERSATSRRRPWSLRVLGGTSERLSFEAGFGVGFSPFTHAALVVDATYFFGSRTENFRRFDVASEGGRVVPSLRFLWPIGRWTLGAGAIAPIELEWANGERLEGATSRFRTLVGFGGEVALDFRWSEGWSLEFAMRSAGRLTEATKSFVVFDSSGARSTVLSPSPVFVAGQIALNFSGL